jgi:hypothetical protein
MSSRSGARRRHGAVAVALVLGGAVVAAAPLWPGPGALAQGGAAGPQPSDLPGARGRAPFPADRVAVVPADNEPAAGVGPSPAGTPPPLATPPPAGGAAPSAAARAMTDLYVAPGVDPAAPEVVVRFAEPFPVPPAGYRISVLVGDPAGEQLAASLITGPASGSTTPVGRLFRFDGRSWHDVGATEAQFDALGFALITVPLAGAPPGPAVWVEISQGSPLTVERLSPYFSRQALLGGTGSGRLPGDAFGVASDRRGRPDQEALPVATPPTLSIRRPGDGERGSPGVAVVQGGAVPTEIGRQPVTGVVDILRLVDSYSGRRRTPEVRIDRRSGTVGLWDTTTEPAVDRSGDRSWLRTAPAGPGTAPAAATVAGGAVAGTAPAAGAGAAVAGTAPAAGAGAAGGAPAPLPPVEIDLAAAARALGADLDPSLTALGLRRIVSLADGHVIVSEGVLATLASLAVVAPVAAEPAAGPVAVPVAAPAGVPPVAPVALTGVALALILTMAMAGRRRRRVRAAGALVVAAATGAAGDAPADRVPWDGSDGALTAEAERARLRLVTSELPIVISLTSDADELEAEGLALPETGAPVLPRAGQGVLPADVLAALDDEVSDFRERIAGPHLRGDRRKVDR